MTNEELKNMLFIIDTLLDDAITDSTRQKVKDNLTEVCKLATKALKLQPCEDCISRQAVIDLTWDWESFTNITRHDGLSTLREMRTKIEGLPSVIPQRKMGRWIGCKCSECNYEVMKWNKNNFCPNCGAEMRGEADDE